MLYYNHLHLERLPWLGRPVNSRLRARGRQGRIAARAEGNTFKRGNAKLFALRQLVMDKGRYLAAGADGLPIQPREYTFAANVSQMEKCSKTHAADRKSHVSCLPHTLRTCETRGCLGT